MTNFELQFSSGGDGLHVDLQKLLAHKLAIQGNSGSGKSWLLRTLMEGTHGSVQHLIIDPEGEFRTLREVFDDYVILAAAGGDLDLAPAAAEHPVAALVKAGANIVLDLSDFGELERDEVCAGAVRAVMGLDREHWRHLLVIVDEAQTLAPEGGRHEAALGALTDLAMRGRKRGFGLVVATQRLALLNKSLLAMCSNRLVGLTTLGNDVKRAAEELGFNTQERQALKRLEPGQWFAFGPAISQEVVLVSSAAIRSTHPEPGQLVSSTPPASAELAKVIETLRAYEPEEADDKPRPVGVSEAEVRRRIEEAVAPHRDRATRLAAQLNEVVVVASRNIDSEQRAIASNTSPEQVEKASESHPVLQNLPGPAPELPRPQRRILKALTEMEVLGVSALDRKTVAVLSQQSPKSSAYAAHVATLKAEGFICYSSDRQLALTDKGRQQAPKPEHPLTLAELHSRWTSYLDRYEADLLAPLLEYYPEPMFREQLAIISGRSVTSSAFGAAVASLEKLGLVCYPRPGQIRATELLFPIGIK